MIAKMRSCQRIAMVVIAIPLACCAQTRPRESAPIPSADHPSWQTDARQFGYERFPRKKSVRPLRLVADFADNDHLAIAWESPNTTKENKGRPAKFAEPAQLHVVVLDSKTGRKLSEKEWPTPYVPLPKLLGIPDGRFLVCTDNSLRFLSSSLDTVKEHDLPNHGTCPYSTFELSPSRRTVLISILGEQSRYEEFLSLENLATLSAWTEPRGSIPTKAIAFSDTWVAGYCGEPSEICLRRLGEEVWRPLRSNGLDTRMPKGRYIPGRFLSDEVLAISQEFTTVATIHGEVLFQINSPTKHHFLLRPVSSAGGEKFAIIEGKLRGLQNEALDMYPFASDDRLFVYSIKDRAAILCLKLKGTSPWSPWNVHDNSVAVSPSGRLLALLSDSVLKVYPVP